MASPCDGPDGGCGREGRPGLRLSARYRWLLLAAILPLFLVVLVLASNQYRDQRASVLRGLVQNSATFAIALDAPAREADNHVLQMRAWTESYLASPPDYRSRLREFLVPHYSDGRVDGYTLDGVPGARRGETGQLGWTAGDPRLPGTGGVVLDLALEFFTLVRLTHDVAPYFEWSYFFSADQQTVAIYPWASMDDFLAVGGHASIAETIAAWFDYEIYRAGTPAENPRRAPYWTAPYVDAGGTGAMISHGAPVYVDDRFVGIVGTDLRLATLENLLSGVPLTTGRLVILNDRNQLLADTAGRPADTIRVADDVLPEALTPARLAATAAARGQPVATDGHVVMARSVEHAPWTLVYLVSDAEIAALLLPRLLPYAVILAALTATVFIALYLMRREFISPAFALVQYIRDASGDAAAAQPRLPRLWQTWVDVVACAFAGMRDTARRLQESEGRLQQVLNNSSAVFYVRDRSERFILVNRAFERLMGIKQDEIAGRRLEEVFPEHTAAEFRANDMRVMEQNCVMEFEERVTVNGEERTYISSKFPLFDTGGEIYAVCGISTDITRRKQSEEALREAALGVSEAQGQEVFNALVMHLAQAVGTDFALIGVLEGSDRISTRALCVRGRIADNFSYELTGSPCENVVGREFRFYPDRIQQRFPDDALLVEIGVESYAAIPLFDSSGGVLGLLAILHSQPLHDETFIESILQIFSGRAASELERERADAALRASVASYRAIFEASEDAIFVHDLETGRILDVNRKACEVYGYSHDDLLKATVGDLSSGEPPYTQEDALKLIARAVAGEKLNFEWHRRNRDGSLHWDEVFARRVPIGGHDRILVHTREITARKEAEEKLRASEEQYRSIFNASSDALILWDAHGRIVDINPAAWQMAGCSREEFFARPFEEYIHPSSLAAYNRFKHEVATVHASRVETRAIRRDGSIIELESRSIPMPYQGKPHILTITRDITEQKRAAEELARQREALRQSEKLSAMGELLAGVAHELNNPLAILMGRAALLENKAHDAAVRDEVGKIRTAAERCGRIVRTFLSMARQKPPERRTASLNDVVGSAVDLLGYGLRTSGIELESGLAEELPMLQMDIDQIGQVILNLLVNAQHVLLEQPEPRRIRVETGTCPGGVYCRVSDNGPGVPEALRQRIFDPFFTTKGGNIGTGIGLSVSRGIAREHGGELLLEPSPGGGAAFTLRLPAAYAGSAARADTRPGPGDEPHSGHVLVVDDEPEVAELLADILRSAGLTTAVVHSGQAAVQWLRTQRCDMILSDVRMPDMDGPALWRALRESHPVLARRMAFITGDTLSASIAPFLKETGLPWLEKPFTPEQVLELVARIEIN